MYILATTTIKKNGSVRKCAKRHLTGRYKTIEDARRTAKNINKELYKVEIYTGNWQLVEEVSND